MIPFAALRLLAAAVISTSSPVPTPTPTALPQIAHVVTSDRSEETLRNAVRTTYVVSAADIARNGYRTVGDALASVPGVQIDRYGPIGSSVDYGIRGSSAAQVLVLVDGQPAAGSLADSVQLGTFSTAGVARIEVVEGGGSTLYGTGAIGGIINIITDGSHTPPSATLRYGTFDDRELQVAGDGFSFDRTVANNAYALPVDAPGIPATRNDNDYEGTSARYGLDRAIGAFGVSLRTSLESDHLGTIGFFPYQSPTSREDDVNANAVLTLSHRGPHSLVSLSLDGDRQQEAFGCNAVTDPNCAQLMPSLSTESRSGLSLRDVVEQGASRSIYGIDLSRGSVRSDDGAGDVAVDALAQSAAYAQQTWTGARTEFYAGIRGERDGALGGEFSPSVGARFSLSNAIALKVNAATAFRAPNASELYFPGYGNPGLHAERAQVGDVTLTDDHLLGGMSLGWFENRTRNLIVATCVQFCDPSTSPPNAFPVYLPENVDRSLIEGLTFSTSTLPMHGVVATIGATDLYAASNLATSARLPNDPVIALDLALRWTGSPRGFVKDAGIAERAVGARAGGDTTQPSFDQPAAYANLTAYVRMRLRPHVLLSLRGDNLGNERYAQVYGFPMPGRTFAVELTAR